VDLSDPASLASGTAARVRDDGAGQCEMTWHQDFCWNREMMADFASLPAPLQQEWSAPLIYGACHSDRLNNADVFILARRSRLAVPPEPTALHVDLILEAEGRMVSKEVGAALAASGGNCRDVQPSVSDALLDLLSAQCQDEDVQELREDALEFALKRLWNLCALNLYRQATYAEPPDNGIGVSAQNSIAGKLVGPMILAPWLRCLASAASPQAKLGARRWKSHGACVARERDLWEPRSLRVWCGTWNANGKVLEGQQLREWIRAAAGRWGEEGPQICFLGLQEAVELDAKNVMSESMSLSTSRDKMSVQAYVDANGKPTPLGSWKSQVEAAMSDAWGEGETKLQFVSVRQLVGVILFVFAAPNVVPLLGDVSVETMRTGLGGIVGNKGAVAARMHVGHTTLAVVCAHMAAHTKNVAERNSNYHTIMSGLAFSGPQHSVCYPPRLHAAIFGCSGSGRGGGGTPAPACCDVLSQDAVIFMGDLNYRIDGMTDQAIVDKVAKEELTQLAACDQLRRERAAGKTLWGFQEGALAFGPTYKFNPDSDEYCIGGKGRAPAWCDRILWRGRGLSLVEYSSCMKIRGSDHKPVFALFELTAMERVAVGAEGLLRDVLQEFEIDEDLQQGLQ